MVLALALLLTGPAAAQVVQVTTNATDDTWLAFNETVNGTSRGMIVWLGFDPADGTTPAVLFFNGTGLCGQPICLIQRKDALAAPGDVNTVFAVGSGPIAGQVAAAWRRDTDFPWVWVSSTLTPQQPVILNPFNPLTVNNPEFPAVIDAGCIFWRIQTPDLLNARLPKHVFRVDAATPLVTFNLTGDNNLANALNTSFSTAGCQAAWAFDANTDSGADPLELHFHDGVVPPVTAPPAAADSGIEAATGLGAGHIVYLKDVGGIRQVFLYDTTLASPVPVQLTNYTDANKTVTGLRTDGWNAAWLYGDKDPTFAKALLNADVLLNGDLILAHIGDVTNQMVAAFRMHRGQLAWKGADDSLQYYDGRRLATVEIAPATTMSIPYLADGFIAWSGLSNDGGGDKEIFLFTGTPPVTLAANEPAPPLRVSAAAGDSQVTLTWNDVLGASSYNVYYARQTGVTKTNFASLPGGTKLAGAASPLLVTNLLNNRTYYFVVTAVAGGVEGPESAEASAAPMPDWIVVGSLSGLVFRALAVELTAGTDVYAAGNNTVHKSPDGGASWAEAADGLGARDLRALAAHGSSVYGATIDGDLLRSVDPVTRWVLGADGTDIGEQNKSLAIDPVTPATVYAGDFQLLGMVEPDDSFVIKSTNSGTNWAHTAEFASRASPSGEIRAYALAADPVTSGVLYAGGTGTPNLARSADGGDTWTDVGIPGVSQFVYAIAIHPSTPATLYAGTGGGSPTGIHKSTDSGTSWTAKNEGLPSPPPQINSLVIDPVNPDTLFAGTPVGLFVSRDAGDSWTAHNNGLVSAAEQSINALGVTSNRRLVAATSGGVFLLDLTAAAPVPNASFRGKVRDASKNPVGGASVEARQGGVSQFSTTTNARGGYALNVTAGTYDLVASKAGFLDKTRAGASVSAGQTLGKQGFKLLRPSFFQGTITDKNTTAPLDGALVEALKKGVVLFSTTTAPDGTYNLQVTKGTYLLRATRTDYVTRNKKDQTIGDGKTKTGVNFALTPVP